MALIKCSECGHEVSDKAERCPNCGCPLSYIIENTKERQAEILHNRESLNKPFINWLSLLRNNKKTVFWMAGILLALAIMIPVLLSLSHRCDTCNGTGHIHCSACENGVIPCTNCKIGKTTCNNCNGAKTVECTTSDGSGVKKCSSCKGEGKIPTGDRKACFLCGGSGTLKVSCKNCNGKGYLSNYYNAVY